MNKINSKIAVMIFLVGIFFLVSGFLPGLTGKFVAFFNSLAYFALFTAAISRAIQFLNNLLFTLLRKYFHPSST